MPRNRSLAAIIISLALAASFALASCSRLAGWAVILWPDESMGTSPGQVYPVHAKLNITKVYVLSEKPDSPEAARFEIPQWQVRLFDTSEQAREYAAQFAPFADKFAICLLDGLPVRSSATNARGTERYRLKKNEKIKILGQTEGAKVMVASGELKGVWYEVMCQDGTVGYCFSANLRVIDSTGATMGAAGPSSPLSQAELLSIQTWRPAYYSTMIESGMIDLTRFQLRYGIFFDPSITQVRVNIPEGSWVFSYIGIEPTSDGGYHFEGSALDVIVDDTTNIKAVIRESPTDIRDYAFTRIDDDLRPLIAAEEARRRREFEAIAAAGPELASMDHGSLSIQKDGSFTWAEAGELPSAQALQGAPGAVINGTMSCVYWLSGDLSAEWKGAVSLKSKPGRVEREALFLYRLSSLGLELRPLAQEDVVDGLIASLSTEASIISFVSVR
jgi:hypothetical protein